MITMYEVYSKSGGDFYRQVIDRATADRMVKADPDLALAETEGKEAEKQRVGIVLSQFGRRGERRDGGIKWHVTTVKKMHVKDGRLYGYCYWSDWVVKIEFDYGAGRWNSIDHRAADKVQI